MAYRNHDEKIEVGSGVPTNNGKLTPSVYLDIDSGTLYYRQLGSGGWSAVGATVSAGVTASADELNILDGATLDANELNILDGAATTAARLNGAPTVYKSAAINYNSANLRTGITIFTPAIGDVLLDALIQIDTAFDGTTPATDIAQWTLLANGSGGWFGAAGSGGVSLVGLADKSYQGDQFISGDDDATQSLSQRSSDGARIVPGYFASVDPVQIIVTQDGLKNGAAIGGTAGQLHVYLVVAKPVQL